MAKGMATMTHGSLFAGIGGFDLGFERAGIKTLWAVEKEPFCQAVLRTHFPETEIFDDVRECGSHNLQPVDVISAGFPCQDLSVAGKRRGLAGNRSGLFHELVRILGELKPGWFVLENVPGLFSSNGGWDYFAVVRNLDELGYGVAWRVLDSQHFGVAQRRRRVFIVGCAGKPCPQEVLFESESGDGDFAESGETWTDVAAPLTAGTGVTGGGDEDDPNLAYCLQHSANTRRDGKDNLAVFEPYHDEHDGRGSNFRATDKHPSLRGPNGTDLAYCLREDPGGIGQAHNTTFAVAENIRGEIQCTNVVHSLTSGGGKPGQGYPCVAGPLNTRNGHSINAEDAAGSHVVATALSSSAGHHGHSVTHLGGDDWRSVKEGDPLIISTLLSGENRTGGTRPPGSTVDNADSLIVGALACNSGPNGHDAGNFTCNQAVDAGHLVAYSISPGARELKDDLHIRETDCAKTLDGSNDPGLHQGGTVVASTLGGRNRGDDIDRSGAFVGVVRTHQTGANGFGLLEDGTTHTLDETRGEAVCAETNSDRVRDASGLPAGLDSARYRALGNAVTVSVAEWIGRRLRQAQ